MKTHCLSILTLSLLLPASVFRLPAQVPPIVNFQGRIQSTGPNPLPAQLEFKFALVGPGGGVHWNNDGTTSGNPQQSVTLPVADGLFSVALGDTSLAGMAALSPSVFTANDVRLRLWVRNPATETVFTQLSPDIRLGSVGYAMMSYSVIAGAIGPNKLAANAVETEKLANGAVTELKLLDGAVTEPKLANSAVATAKIKDGAVTAEKLAPGVLASALPPNLDLGAAGVCGTLDLFSTDIGTPGLTLNGCQSEISAFIQTNGVEAVELKAYDYGGLLTLRDPRARMSLRAGSSGIGGFAQWYNEGGRLTAVVDGSSSSSLAGVGNGYLSVAETNGNSRVELLGIGSGGVIQARNSANARTVWIAAGNSTNGAGEINVANPGGQARLFLGGNHNGGGIINVMDTNGTVTAEIMGAESGSTGGKIRVRQANGTATVSMDGDASGQGGWFAIYNNEGGKTIEMDGAEGAGNGGQILLYRGDGTKTLEIDGEWGDSGQSRIITDVLEIKGGSDLSENFDITAQPGQLTAGMIVCIDPAQPGQLVTSSKAYDRTVAGIVSGAGGVQPGMLMGQRGTAADGKHPVALTGRVYCWADAGQGAIEPGDLITTSDTPGHGMKVSDPQKAQGAIIGKAMSKLEAGKGLVLVMVSLQ